MMVVSYYLYNIFVLYTLYIYLYIYIQWLLQTWLGHLCNLPPSSITFTWMPSFFNKEKLTSFEKKLNPFGQEFVCFCFFLFSNQNILYYLSELIRVHPFDRLVLFNGHLSITSHKLINFFKNLLHLLLLSAIPLLFVISCVKCAEERMKKDRFY